MPLIRLFMEICLFRKGPQHTPDSRLLLWLALAAFCLVGAVQSLLEEQWQEMLVQIPLQALILPAFLWFSLQAAGKMQRMTQTLTALLATDALLSCLSIPLQALALVAPQDGIIRLLQLLLMLWHLAVFAHILRHALSQTLAVGLALSFVYTAFTLQLLILLFGPPAASG